MDPSMLPNILSLFNHFTKIALKVNPPDLINFAAEYFTNYDRTKEEQCWEQFKLSNDKTIESDLLIQRYVDVSKTEDERYMLEKKIKDINILSKIEDDDIQTIIRELIRVPVKDKDLIIKQGKPGRFFYIIGNGSFSVILSNGACNKIIRAYDNEGSFGELALLYVKTRSASVIAERNGYLWALPGEVLKKVLFKDAVFKYQEQRKQLIKSPILQMAINPISCIQLLDTMKMDIFRDGDIIYKQDDPPEGMYFISEGKVRLVKSIVLNNGLVPIENEIVDTFFGDDDMFFNRPRVATAYAIGEVTLYFFDHQFVELFLGPNVEDNKKSLMDYLKNITSFINFNKYNQRAEVNRINLAQPWSQGCQKSQCGSGSSSEEKVISVNYLRPNISKHSHELLFHELKG